MKFSGYVEQDPNNNLKKIGGVLFNPFDTNTELHRSI